MKANQKDFFCENLTGVSSFQKKQQHKKPLNMAEQSGLGGTKPRPQLDELGKFRMAIENPFLTLLP
tara:strand:+ start:1145 stop:1342 length:198 start_codon:yes stop_codon:yes gene_type:complete